jgi:peptidoglycan hydrolase CwlO-like protein
MNTVNGWLIAWGLAMSLVAAYFAFLAISKERAMEALASRKQKIIDTVTKERYEAQKQCRIAQEQREKLNRENDALHKHFEIMKESLKVAQAEVEHLLEEVARLQKSADHATIPLVESVTPEPPKRTRKKAGQV